jgi:GT2 family glycosyltransferase
MTGTAHVAIDVVIPVYNAPELTRRCIESLYRHAADRIGHVHVYDNASAAETRDMLDALALPRLRVHHAERNTGFGDAVNRALQRTSSELVLVLNSDVEASSDFVSPLLDAMQGDRELAALTPAGNTFAGYRLDRYALRSGCVVTHNLYAYAFLVRRAAFDAVGRFDPAFGLGYFEDSDLSRKLLRAGWWIGICPRSQLQHAIHGSFGKGPAVSELMTRNRALYAERYPEALRNLLVVSGRTHLAELPSAVRRELESFLAEGGHVRWLTRAPLRDLPALEVRGARGGLAGLVRMLQRHRSRERRRFSQFWVVRDAPATARLVLPAWAAADTTPLRWIDPSAQASAAPLAAP